MRVKNARLFLLQIVATVTAVVVIITAAATTVEAGVSEWVTNGPQGCVIHSIVVSPRYANDKTLYSATDHGVYKSTNGGQSWSQSGLSTSQVFALAISPETSTYNTLFAGTGSSVYKSTDSGQNWTTVTTVGNGIQSLAISPAYSSDHTIFMGTNGDGIYLSTDAGSNWSQTDLTDVYVSAIAASPSFATNHTVYAATSDGNGVYKSTNDGVNWSQVGSSDSGLDISYISAIAVSPNDSVIYAGCYKSIDDGVSWSLTDIPNDNVASIAFSPSYAADHTIFVGTDGGGVYKSTNSGTTWTSINTDLSNLYVRALATTPNYSSNHNIFAGTWGSGVFTCITQTDKVSPTVLTIDPTASATNVPKDKIIAVTFSEKIQAGSAYNIILLKDSSNNQITTGKSISGRVLSIDPSTDLTLGGTYTLIVPKGTVKDTAGNSLASQYTLTFTVVAALDKTPPTVSSTDPTTTATGVGADKTIAIKFSEEIQQGTAYANISMSGSVGGKVAFSKSISSNTLIVDPTTDLASGISYTVMIPAKAVKDASNNLSASQSTVSFTVLADTTAPTVSTATPLADSTMGKDTSITVTFSEAVQAGTAFTTIALKSSTSTAVAFNKTIVGKVLSIDPTNSLVTGVSYTLTLPASSIKDAAGNALAAQYTLTFTAKDNTGTPSTPQDFKLVSSKDVIQLSWKASTDQNLTGYNIYRKIKGAAGDANKLTSTPQTDTAYQDKTAEAGKTYVYYATVVNKTNSESAKSTEIEATLGKEVPKTQPKENTATADAATESAATPFKDVKSDVWYLDYVTNLASSGVIGGYPDGTFRPENNVTRAEFAKMLCVAMGWDLGSSSTASFKDVGKDSWESQYVETAKSNGVIGGYKDSTFRPQNSITRAEIAKIVSETLKLPEGSSTLKDIGKSWANAYINSCVKAGIVGGYSDSTYKPTNTATRAEVSKIISSVVDQK